MTPSEFLHLPLAVRLCIVALFFPAIWACGLLLAAAARDLSRLSVRSRKEADSTTREWRHES